MTHFGVVVLVPEGTTAIEKAVTKLLAPYDEGGEWGKDGSRWDWWQIGGRFSGYLSPDYDPEKDPRNIEADRFCEATGITTAAVAAQYPAYLPHVGKTCPQCDGTGSVTKWPTQWATAPEHNIRPAVEVPWDALEYHTAIVTPDGEWHEAVEGGYGMFGAERGTRTPEDEWKAEFVAFVAANPSAIAVIVDCHV